jgi:hypothetical protein
MSTIITAIITTNAHSNFFNIVNLPAFSAALAIDYLSMISNV